MLRLGRVALLVLLVASRLPAEGRAVVLHGGSIQGELDHCGCRGGLGGLGRRAAAVAAVRAEGFPVFLLDAGDAFLRARPGQRAARPDAQVRAEAMAGWLGRMGLDLQVPGGKDLQLGWPRLRRLLTRGGITAVAANLVEGPAGVPAAAAWRVLERQGFRLGVVGVVAPDLTLAASDGDLRLLPPREPVQAAVDAAREVGVDALVLLSHLGFSGDLALLRELRGVDVVVGGRTGERLERPVVLSGVPVVQAGVRGKSLGRLDLGTVDGALRVEHRILDLSTEVGEDPAVAAEVRAYLRAHPAGS